MSIVNKVTVADSLFSQVYSCR